jgi:hypothetical protein
MSLMPRSILVMVVAAGCGGGSGAAVLAAPDTVGPDVSVAAKACTGTQTVAQAMHIAGPLVLDEENVYFVDTAVRRAPKAGGPSTALAPAGSARFSLAADDQFLYWVAAGTLYRVAKAGGPVLTLASTNDLQAVAVDETTVYYLDADGLWTMAKSGGPATQIAASSGGVMVLDAQWVYVASARTKSIVRVAKLGNASIAIADNLARPPLAIGVDASTIYFSDPSSSLFAVDKNGGAIRTIYAATNTLPVPVDGLLVDGGRVYWTGYGGIQRIDTSGAGFALLAVDDAHGLALDGSFVYWSSANADAILRGCR